MNYYTVTLPDSRTIMHVKAKKSADAKATALAGLQVKRLTTDDVLELTARGIAIVSAETGQVCNATSAAADPT